MTCQEDKNGIFKLDILKMLLDHSHREANLFWTRNNIFIISNLTAFGLAIKWAFNDTNPAPKMAKIIIGCVGILFCIIWFLFNKIGRRMNHVWVKDAKDLAKCNNAIKPLTKNSLGEDTPSEASNCLGKLNSLFKSATCLNYLVILLFLVAWCLLIFLSEPINSSSFSQAYSKTIEQLNDVGINKGHLYLRSSNYDSTKKIYILLFEDTKSTVTYQINFDTSEKRIVNYIKK